MRRVLGVTTLVVALTVALAGCSYLDDAGGVVDEVQKSLTADHKLSKLTEELRERSDVDKVQEQVLAVDMTAGVDVVMKAHATTKGITEVASRVDEVLRDSDLRPFKRAFTVKAGDANIQQTDFEQTPIDYAAELSYWEEVKSAVGPHITLTVGTGRDGSLQRIFSTQTDATVVTIANHVDLLTALDPPNGTDTMWRLPGIAGYTDWLGPLPEAKVLTFMATMAGVTNLLDDSVMEKPPGVYVYLQNQGSTYPPQFMFVSPEPANRIEAAAQWQLGIDMAREALITELPSMGIAIQTYGHELYEDPYIHVGECLNLMPPTPADRKLVADLVASGVDLPDSAAGHCIAFANP